MAKKGYMKPDEVKRAVVSLFGKESGGQRRLAAAIGKHELTVSRWVRGEAPVGETEAILIRLLVKTHARSYDDSQLSFLD